MSVITAQLPFDFELSGAAQDAQYLMMKNSQQGFVLDASLSLNEITDADYPGWKTASVTSITRSGSVATVTMASATNFKSGISVTIAGAAQTEYNGAHRITVTGATTFTYTVEGSPTTPATGTIAATGGITTVHGIVWLDGTFYVMDDRGTIYGSDLNDPASWNALNFITAIKEPGNGVALAKSQNYVIAFKQWSTEFFFDAGNAEGSPLSPVDNGFVLIGCASGASVANVSGTLFWISQTRQRGRAVHMMVGLEQAPVSTPDVERIINADDLSSVVAYGAKISGQTFYVLTLKSSDITLVYNVQSKTWTRWTSLTEQVAQSCSIVRSGSVATATCAGHGFADGDPVYIADADQTEYNGRHQVSVIDANVFSFSVEGSPASPATGAVTATGFTASYFKFTSYVYANGKDLVMHETSGGLFEITEAATSDAENPIDCFIRTSKFDGMTTRRKTCGRIEVIGNKTDSDLMLRWSDDDNQTHSNYRRVSLSADRPQLTRCGSFRRRSLDLRHVANASIQLSALEMEMGVTS